MACKTSCKLCPHLVLSQSVTFANDTLTVNIPAGAYQNGEKYCIVIAQTRTRYATRVATSATGTGTFKYLGCFCRSHAGAPASIS